MGFFYCLSLIPECYFLTNFLIMNECFSFQVCAINAVIIVLLAISMPSGVIQRALSYCFLIWSSLVILAKMCYQLQFVQEDVFQHNCSNSVRFSSYHMNHLYNILHPRLHLFLFIPVERRPPLLNVFNLLCLGVSSFYLRQPFH
jgi:hypothetical protein